MSNRVLRKPVALAIGAALMTSLGAAGVAQASSYAVSALGAGYMLAGGEEEKAKEGKCGADKKAEGEGKCGADKKAEGEGKCGADKKAEGEGKCGADKKAEGKCGEGKCGADKKEEEKPKQ